MSPTIRSITIASILFTLSLTSAGAVAQTNEGQVLLKLGGPNWESLGVPPVIIYLKGGKALAKLVTGFVNEDLYIDEASGTMMVVNSPKKTGHKIALTDVDGPVQDLLTPLPEPLQTHEEERIGPWLCTLYQDSIPDKDAVIDIWATDQLPKEMRTTFSTLLQRVWYGFTGDRRFGALKDMFVKRGLMPIQIGARRHGETQPASTIQFLWFDEVKLSDSTFVIPPDITVTPVK
jgi:hypothetical protein